MSGVRKISIHGMSKEQKEHIQSLMQAAHIPGISVATISSDGEVKAAALGLVNVTQPESKIDSDTQFWACSLSKPVFAYLVVKLTQDGTLPGLLDEKISFKGKELTPRMMLSHQTGLPNEGPPDPTFDKSEPKKVFRYSGEGYHLLQSIIEERTGKKLHELAKEKIFDLLGMTRSTFLFPEDEKNLTQPHNAAMIPNPLLIPKRNDNDNNSAGSLHTTAGDYARFLVDCMSNPKFVEMFIPQIEDMEKDIDSKEAQKESKESKVSSQTLKLIDWGLGFGLQKDEEGQVISAFHWGHGPGARTFFSINRRNNSAVVYLTNSENGMAIADDIAKPIGSVSPTMQFLSEKYGYRQIDSPDWKKHDELLMKEHEILMTGIKKEKEGDFEQAISAYREAIKLMPDKKHELEYRIVWAETQSAQKISAEKPPLDNFTGQYGPLEIFVTDSKLQINIGVPPPHDLKVINNNTLLDGDIILKISRNKDGSPSSLTCYFPNNQPSPSFPSVPAPKITIKHEEKNSSRSGTAHTALLLGVSPSSLTPSPKGLHKQDTKEENSSHSSSPKAKGVDVTDEEMARSAFGRGSHTAKKLSR